MRFLYLLYHHRPLEHVVLISCCKLKSMLLFPKSCCFMLLIVWVIDRFCLVLDNNVTAGSWLSVLARLPIQAHVTSLPVPQHTWLQSVCLIGVKDEVVVMVYSVYFYFMCLSCRCIIMPYIQLNFIVFIEYLCRYAGILYTGVISSQDGRKSLLGGRLFSRRKEVLAWG